MSMLLDSLHLLTRKENDEWMAELDERKKQEVLFHDKYRETSINPAHKYYSVADGVQSTCGIGSCSTPEEESF